MFIYCPSEIKYNSLPTESCKGSYDPFNHYGTTYNLQHGKHWVHRELSYDAAPGNNFMWSKRCHIGYRSSLDDYDNPFLKPIIKTNYLSVTHRDYVGNVLPTGKTSLINNFNGIVPAGYMYHTELTVPKHMHNPNDWTTSYNREFDARPGKPVDFYRDPIGRKEETGYTLNNPTIDTLSFLPHSTYRNDWPKSQTNRPTGVTHYSSTFLPFSLPNGNEPLPGITPHSDQSSGFVKGNQQRPDFIPSSQEMMKPRVYTPQEIKILKKTDPMEYLNAIHPPSYPPTTHGLYTDPLKQPQTEEELLNRVNVGEKEATGFVNNQDVHVESRDDPNRFITHYMTKFYDPTVNGPERNGHTDFNVDTIKLDGFVRNNGVHMLGSVQGNTDPCLLMDHNQERSYSRNYVTK